MKKLGKEGFSLVEMLIAMAITAILLSGLMLLLTYGANSVNNTQARVSLQDAAKDAVNHISTHVMEGTTVTTYDDVDGSHHGGILIQNSTVEDDGTESSDWYLYWVSRGIGASDPAMLCYAPLDALEKPEESGIARPANFEEKTKDQKQAHLSAVVTKIADKKLQKRHLLCDDVDTGGFKCYPLENKKADDTVVGQENLKVELKLKDADHEKIMFECDKTITMRNQ